MIDGHEHPVVIRQEAPRSSDLAASARLTIDLSRVHAGRQTRWTDRKHTFLDRRLGEILTELAVRAEHDEIRRSSQTRAMEERRAQWEAAMAEAGRLARHEHHARLLRSQAAEWDEIRALRRYVSALRKRLSETDADPGRESATEWLRWAEKYIANLNLLRSLPSDWDDHSPEPEELVPFLDGWSPHGPGAAY